MHTKAIECWDKCIDLEPNESIFYSNKGITLNKLERYAESKECFGKAIETNPKENYNYYYLGFYFFTFVILCTEAL